ncbi:MAG: pyrroline-5-carboxylate reductase [Syntrophorhabdaceae bacterium]|jgi:pyrroline-5-carboxylate reductase|nr:pyrroline-5-carboxylate reductase [Syntrophorhabdaceae bacterium]MDD5244668.1 pyrroline-5-carboxylate reductase [Syntrophorhabdaceae bacterium]
MKKIGIIGVGNMGESIIKALLKKGATKETIIFSEIKKERARAVKKSFGIRESKKLNELVKNTDYIILAVKPQDSRTVLTGIAPFLDLNKIIITIMAGVTTSNILSIVGKPVKIVKAMPNICVKVGEGVIGIAHNKIVKKEEVKKVKDIFEPLGKVVEIGEELMDAITALGASGPAFFLLFLEAMIDAGLKIGIPREKARVVSAQVVKGTLKMLEEEGIHPTVMRDMITSPGGTTISGIAVLEEKAFKGIIIEAIEKASKRAKELSL